MINKMKEVARLFDKDLNEPFVARYCNSVCICRFTKEGLDTKSDSSPIWHFNRTWLNFLLNGEAEIVDP